MKKIGKHRGESNGELIIHKLKNAQHLLPKKTAITESESSDSDSESY